MSRGYGTLPSPDEEGVLGASSILAELGRSQRGDDDEFDMKAASVVGGEGDGEGEGEREDEGQADEEYDEEEDLVPFLDDHDPETQRLLETRRMNRRTKTKGVLLSKNMTSLTVFVLTVLGLLGMLLVADTVFGSDGDVSTPIFESSADVIISSATANSTRA